MLQVRELMTADPYTLPMDASLADVYDLMDSKHVRHVPVVSEDGGLQGIASHRDLVRGALYGVGEMPFSTVRHMLRTKKAAEVMTQSPETVGPDDDVTVAGVVMTENKFGCLPVVDGGRLVGILTEADFVRFVVETAG